MNYRSKIGELKAMLILVFLLTVYTSGFCISKKVYKTPMSSLSNYIGNCNGAKFVSLLGLFNLNFDKFGINERQHDSMFGNIEMVYVEGGSFIMGNDSSFSDERPSHNVVLNNYYISKYEVTQKQWLSLMDSLPRYIDTCINCPIVLLTWNDIQEFFRRLNNKYSGHTFRLPTEAEWEYAAKGGKKTRNYRWCGVQSAYDLDKYAWYGLFSVQNTPNTVGLKLPNELGLYDMSGNVSEICNDWLGRYDSLESNNPQGPPSGVFKVVRGGNYDSDEFDCRVDFRNGMKPESTYDIHGFRIVCER